MTTAIKTDLIFGILNSVLTGDHWSKQAEKGIGRQAGRKRGKQADRQAGRQTDKQKARLTKLQNTNRWKELDTNSLLHFAGETILKRLSCSHGHDSLSVQTEFGSNLVQTSIALYWLTLFVSLRSLTVGKITGLYFIECNLPQHKMK